MTDELKATEETKKCDCKEKAIQKLKEFAFISGAVFVGATLSILLCASILKPKCPMAPFGPMGPRPAMHRQLPPPMMLGNFDRDFVKRNRGDCPCRKLKKHNKHKFSRKNFKRDWNKDIPQKEVQQQK